MNHVGHLPVDQAFLWRPESDLDRPKTAQKARLPLPPSHCDVFWVLTRPIESAGPARQWASPLQLLQQNSLYRITRTRYRPRTRYLPIPRRPGPAARRDSPAAVDANTRARPRSCGRGDEARPPWPRPQRPRLRQGPPCLPPFSLSLALGALHPSSPLACWVRLVLGLGLTPSLGFRGVGCWLARSKCRRRRTTCGTRTTSLLPGTISKRSLFGEFPSVLACSLLQFLCRLCLSYSSQQVLSPMVLELWLKLNVKLDGLVSIFVSWQWKWDRWKISSCWLWFGMWLIIVHQFSFHSKCFALLLQTNYYTFMITIWYAKLLSRL